ncbi:unnamed protein product [Rotaria sp. Silwood1]|nr:unnamed protein product [Rotaria sp. Silwood1]CAF0989483.1 unnamed protein product [Rotaria sp. Silwood1]CAF0998404.1 unnamed protein product [Rotaria sp. Silwood1]CAF3395898.1 unnamed protein product [Rotaria sp. Silwood1]CAF3420009.1 unnamed protein product [Rotaria sp. Silwood1]
MNSYSQHYTKAINEDNSEDDTTHQLNDSSSNIKLRRTNTDALNYPILHRALSTVSANQTLVYNQRNVLAKNFRRISINDEIVTIDHNDADASFLLPNLYELPDDIRTRVMDSLVDTTTMTTLEETKRLNWWVNKKLTCPKLYPLLTSGDGNCLLHATSLAMWGFHDHSLSMRKALNETMITSKPNNSLYRRWRWAQSVQNKKYGLVFSEQEWSDEWKSLLRLSSAEPRVSQKSSSNSNKNSSDPNIANDEINCCKSSQTGTPTSTGGSTKSSSPSTRQYYESLEEFHVYVLANNIRRPIIVYSDTILRTNDGEAISPIEFGGIYLPLEIPPEKCHKQPVFLAFDAAHFSALVPMEQNTKQTTRATYRIPLIDIDATDLLPIHYFIDPGPNFVWPIDEELSDEKIYLYTHYGESRMETLEKYLYLSKELCPLNMLISSSTTNTNIHDDITSTNDNNPSSTINIDISTSTNETTSTIPSIINKKSSRPSFNSFSKIIRRTFIEPFSSVKRASLKQHRQQTHSEISDTIISNENEHVRRASSPLLNRRTNILTIIVTNFQPKRPKTCDNMIKNYIDACMNEYRLEQNSKQMNAISVNINENNAINNNHVNWNNDLYSSSSSSQQPIVDHRYHSSTNTNRYKQTIPSITNTNQKLIETSGRKLPSVPISSTNKVNPLTKNIQKNHVIDDNDDLLPMENGQFSSNINYVQQTQRKSNQLTQSNSLETSYGRHHYPESYVNGLSSNRSIKISPAEELPINRPTSNAVPSKLQLGVLKRQQSLGYDKNMHSQRSPESNINNRGSIKTNNTYNNNNNQSK